MRKPLVIAALLLCCSLATAQEADNGGGAGTELSVVARAEYLSGDDPLGNSCLYALADGTLTEAISYSASLHLLSSSPLDLYRATLCPGESSWLDWAYLSYQSGSMEFSVGKDMLPWANYEMDEYDFDVHYPLASSVWLNLPVYQWGARASWKPSDEMGVDLRLSSSPFSARPFSGGLFSFGFKARYEQEDMFGLMVSYNSIDESVNSRAKILSTGLQGYFGQARLVADFNSKIGDADNVFIEGMSTSLSCTYTFDDSFELVAKLCLDNYDAGNLNDDRAGVAIHWYPEENLRVHALSAYRFGDIARVWSFSVGVTYNFNISL